MKRRHFIPLILCLLLCGRAFAEPQEIDKELSTLAGKLAAAIKEHGNKKVTVLDFTDLHGNPHGELGKYIAEQLTVDLVMGKQGFAVLDRANLKSILAEHKLTATGLVDPENAKKLGQFAGVDAMIVGTIIPKKDKVSLNIEIITTDTAVIISADWAEFKADDTVRQLVAAPATEAKGVSGLGGTTEKPAIVKTLGDLRVELQSLKIVDDRKYILSMLLTNQNPRKSIWVALRTDLVGELKGSVTSPNSSQYGSDSRGVSGVNADALQHGGFFKPTEIKVNEAVPVTVKFSENRFPSAESGACTVQLEFLIGSSYDGSFGNATSKNMVVKMEAE